MAGDISKLEPDMKRVRSILDDYIAAPAVAVFNSKNYPIYTMNRAFIKMLGYESERNLIYETKGKLAACIISADLDAAIDSVKSALEKNDRFNISCRLEKRDGTQLWTDEYGKLTQLSNGRDILICVFDEVERHDETVRELEASRAAAENANNSKTEFLARMSHDMRTPLNGIIGFTDLALHEENIDYIKKYLSQIAVSGQFLLGLINDVLDMAKIESGNVELQAEPFTQDDFLTYIRAVISPLCNEKNIKFEINKVPAPSVVLADKLRVEQIIFNLLSNAVKYTPQDGTVKLDISQYHVGRDNLIGLRFVITDTGIGMSEDFIKKAFNAFSREETGKSAVTQGAGLGLTIVQALVSEMKGTIKIESEPDKGTRVVVHLIFPIAKDAMTICENEISLENLQDKNILVAEDNDMNALLLCKLLNNKGMTVERAENGQEALEMFMENEAGFFDAILMDVRMPIMDGIAATKAIRRLTRPDAQEIPIFAVTANAFENDIKECLAAGMNGHLGKPIDPPKLFLTLAKGLRYNKTISTE